MIEPDVRLFLDAGSGSQRIKIQVKESLRFGDRTIMRFAGGLPFTDSVNIYSAQTDQLYIGTDVVLYGLISAPDAEVHMYSRSLMNGTLFGKRVIIEPDAIVCAPDFTFSDMTALAVKFKDLDNVSQNTNTRNLGFKLINRSNKLINLRDVMMNYCFTDPSKANNFEGGVTYLHIINRPWQYLGLADVNMSFSNLDTTINDPLYKGNRQMSLTFSNGCLLPNDTAEIKVTFRSRAGSVINETDDPSYVSSSVYVFAPGIGITYVIPKKLDNLFMDAGRILSVDLRNYTYNGTTIHTFTELIKTVFTRKYIKYASSGNDVRVITIDGCGGTYNFNQMVADERNTEKAKYGILSKQLYNRVTNSNNLLAPIPVVINSMIDDIPYNHPPIITSNNVPPDLGVWEQNNKSALDARRIAIHQRALHVVNSIQNAIVNHGLATPGFNPQVKINDDNGSITAVLNANILRNSSLFDSAAIIVKNDSVSIAKDMWTAGFRMNVDNFHYYGFQGNGINAAVWEGGVLDQGNVGGYPNFFNQLVLPAENSRFSRWDIQRDQKQGLGDPGYDQHVAYMLAAIKNNRSKKIDPSAPTTFCGTGFAPKCNLYLANFTAFLGPDIADSMLFNPLTWCSNKDITVINQSWHTVSTEKVFDQNWNSEYVGDQSYDDPIIDMYASTYPYPTFCQAAGNLASATAPNAEFVNHKGYNTIVVGQDVRDGGMSATSVFKNPNSKQELPHVTCGVAEGNQNPPGASMFESGQISCFAAHNNRILAGSSNYGIFTGTLDNSDMWTWAIEFYANKVTALAVIGNNIFAASFGENPNIAVSTDDGMNWKNIATFNSSSLQSMGKITSLAAIGNNLFVGALDGILLTPDFGTTWTTVKNGLSCTDVNALTVSGNNLFAGTEGGGVFLSSNNGASWNTASTGLTNLQIIALASSGNNIFAATTDGIFRSANNGTSWAIANTGLTNTHVNCITANSGTIYAGTEGGVFVSTDNGTSWNAINNGLTETSISAFYRSGNNFFAGSYNGRVFQSTNNGLSWAWVNNGLSLIDKSVVTTSGGTSIASAMCSGFVASLQSINPTLLKHSPWAIKAILMSGGVPIENGFWNSDPSTDRRDGTGRLNGINAWLTATHPYTTGVGGGSGFYIDQIQSGATYEKIIPIVPTQSEHIQIALAWFGNVNTANWTTTLSDLNLELVEPNGNVKGSYSLKNPEQFIRFSTPLVGQQYQIRITTASPVPYITNFGVAWVNR